MKDRDFAYFVAAAGVLIILWILSKRGSAATPAAGNGNYATANPADSTLPIPWDEPMNDVYDQSTAANGAYAPPTAADLTLNVQNSALATLSDEYMPMFGFVGIAQGAEWG